MMAADEETRGFTTSVYVSPDGHLKEPVTTKDVKSGVISAFRNVTVEPVMFLHMIGSSMTSLIVQNIYLDRICRVDLDYSDDVCRQLLNNTGNRTVEEEVDSIASKYSLYRTFVESLFPILFAIFLGHWSDKHGSKFPLLLPLFGYVLSTGIFTLFCFLPDLPPIYLIIASLPISLTGGMVALVLSALSYITNVSNNKNRSTRFAAMEACWFLGSPIGSLGGAKLYKALGFAPIFIIAGTCYSIALCYGLVFIQNDKNEIIEDDEDSNCCTDMFNIEAVKDTVYCVFARREPPRRLWLWLLILIITAKVMTTVGVMSCMFLFTRHQFGWNEQNYSLFTTVDSLVGTSGTIIMTIVGLKLLKLGDTFIAIFSTIGCLAANVLVALAPQDSSTAWIIYVASGIQMFGGMTTIMTRSMFSKIVTKNEVGKIFTFISCIEVAIMPMGASSLYSLIFMKTLKTFAGAFSLVNAGANGVILITFIFLFFSMRKAPDIEELPEDDDDEDDHIINN